MKTKNTKKYVQKKKTLKSVEPTQKR